MLYKASLWAIVLLVGTPIVVWSQEVSPIVVETLRESTIPTTIRTGEPFIQVYKIQYIRSEKWGKEVVVLEDDMKPKSYPSPFDDFEIINWSMSEPVTIDGEETDERTRFLTITIRIINPKKGEYKIPKLSVKWALKIGEKIENQEPIETEIVHLNYVSTITDDPYIDIRDGVDFGDYSGWANLFWYVSRAGVPLAMSLCLYLIFSSLKKAKKVKRQKVSGKTQEAELLEAYVYENKNVSFKQAYKNFFREFRRFRKQYFLFDGSEGDNVQLLRVVKRFAPAIDSVLRSCLSGLSPGDTVRDMRLFIERDMTNLSSYRYRSALIFLQQKLVGYQADIESGKVTHLIKDGVGNIDDEISSLRSAVRRLKLRWRVLESLGKRL